MSESKRPRSPSPPEASAEGLPKPRPTSKDRAILGVAHLLGKIPDNEVARLARVSMRTVAAYRERNNIPGFKGQRRPSPVRNGHTSCLDAVRGLVGRLPDRYVADLTGMSLGAVRNYRLRNDIQPNGRVTAGEAEEIISAWAADRRQRAARRPAPVGEPATWRVLMVGGSTRELTAFDAGEALERALALVSGQSRKLISVQRILIERPID